ncbi:MAG: ParB/RepB/Spo0J family partition protein [Terracidiphilus sp.]|jgi:ParB family chromosome partitioning protein
METTVINATEYRELPLALLNESKTNPRRVFDDVSLRELAASIRSQGMLSPLLVRPLTENGFEIVAGARRYRAAQMAESVTVPVRIVNLSDAEALAAQLVENLIRAEIHPMEEAEGFARLLALEEPKYSIEQIGARVGKSAMFVASRLKLIDLVPAAVDAFYANEIGVGHALLLAKLPADQQEQALAACFKEAYNSGGATPTRILLPVRNLQFWIETNVLLILKDAPFDKRDAQLVSTAGSCIDCPKRTGHNKLLFGDDLGKQGDQCTDPRCYNAKLAAHVAKAVAAKPGIVQISTAYGGRKEGSPVLPRNKYTAIRDDKPQKKEDAQRPEFKVCKFATDAIITEGSDIGTIHKVCANPDCPIHHASKQRPATDAAFKAEQEKRRREEAIAQATGLRVLKATSDAVPVRLMKRDLLFVSERLAAALDERRLAILLRIHGIGKTNGNAEAPAKLLASFLRKADESTLGRVLVAITILQSAHSSNESAKALREAAEFYKVDVAAITSKVKQEFAAKDRAKTTKKAMPKPPAKAVKGARAA